MKISLWISENVPRGIKNNGQYLIVGKNISAYQNYIKTKQKNKTKINKNQQKYISTKPFKTIRIKQQNKIIQNKEKQCIRTETKQKTNCMHD